MRALVLVIAACGYEHGALVRDSNVGGEPALVDMVDPCAAAAAALNCPEQVVKTGVMCNGACWAKCQSNTGMREYDVAMWCTTWGGRLAPLLTPADNDCVAQTLWPGDAHWIGFEQAFSAGTPAQGWTWNGVSVSTYTNWDAGQPNDFDGFESDHLEQCAFMNTLGKWSDMRCQDFLFRFSCRHN